MMNSSAACNNSTLSLSVHAHAAAKLAYIQYPSLLASTGSTTLGALYNTMQVCAPTATHSRQCISCKLEYRCPTPATVHVICATSWHHKPHTPYTWFSFLHEQLQSTMTKHNNMIERSREHMVGLVNRYKHKTLHMSHDITAGARPMNTMGGATVQPCQKSLQ